MKLFILTTNNFFTTINIKKKLSFLKIYKKLNKLYNFKKEGIKIISNGKIIENEEDYIKEEEEEEDIYIIYEDPNIVGFYETLTIKNIPLEVTEESESKPQINLSKIYYQKTENTETISKNQVVEPINPITKEIEENFKISTIVQSESIISQVSKPKIELNVKKINQIIKMGFTEEQATYSLEITFNNVEQAIELLLENDELIIPKPPKSEFNEKEEMAIRRLVKLKFEKEDAIKYLKKNNWNEAKATNDLFKTRRRKF